MAKVCILYHVAQSHYYIMLSAVYEEDSEGLIATSSATNQVTVSDINNLFSGSSTV